MCPVQGSVNSEIVPRNEVDFVANWPKTGPIFSKDLYQRCCHLAKQSSGFQVATLGLKRWSPAGFFSGSVLGEERVIGIFAVHADGALALVVGFVSLQMLTDA